MRSGLPEGLRVEAVGAVRVVTLDRPEHLNAIDRDLHRRLAKVWGELEQDPDARAVVLTGAGRAFSAGGDLEWITSFLHDPEARDDSLREAAEIVEALIRFPLPIVAAVNGPAVGLGCSIAILCDVLLVDSSTYLCDPHVSVGLVAGDGGAAFWPLLTPLLRSREYLLTGARIPAATAVELGLATRTVPADRLVGEAMAVARRMAAQPPEAVRGTKRVLNLHFESVLGHALPAGIEAERATMTTPEHRERLLALRRGTS